MKDTEMKVAKSIEPRKNLCSKAGNLIKGACHKNMCNRIPSHLCFAAYIYTSHFLALPSLHENVLLLHVYVYNKHL